MAKLEVKRGFPGKSASKCYQAGLDMVVAAGYKIFKKRDIASLVICEGVIEGNPVNLSLMVPLSSPTQVVLSLDSSGADEAMLASEGDRLFDLLEEKIKGLR
jgi:hypothetical protein